MESLRLPSRYEDLDVSYRGRLIPDTKLLALVNEAKKSMEINGGIRFLPIYGKSGSGKSCAALEISTHMPETRTFLISRNEIESKSELIKRIYDEKAQSNKKLLIAVIDQYEENVVGKEKIPTQFVEHLSLLDRSELRKIPILFIWLTTSINFRDQLVTATNRNRRILLNNNCEIMGPHKNEWAKIIQETFSFHNSDKCLADYGIIENNISSIADKSETLGAAIEFVGTLLGKSNESLQNLSDYRIILMWPVADSVRNTRVLQFSNPREGYKLNWEHWFSQLNKEDKEKLPLDEFNRTRLYFDMRIIPVRAADLQRLCYDLNESNVKLAKTYLDRFKKTHFFHVISDSWDKYDYNPVRERESRRAEQANEWYKTVTNKPVPLGRRIAYILKECGLDAEYEKVLKSPYSSVRTDVFVNEKDGSKKKIAIELKVYSSENTMPSSIKDAIKSTLKKYAQFAGFLAKQ